MDMVATVLASLAAPGQHDRLLRLHTPLGGERLVAERFGGIERIDEVGFRLEVTALSTDAALPLDALLGKPVLLELLAAGPSQRRPFHGHVTTAERIGSNGGLARYRLVVEPWFALLGKRVDSYVFHDMSVVEIVESVFSDYAGQGALAPAWRWNLADPSVYARRSLTTQYEESDLAFVQRLLAEEGIYYWFEHEGDAGADTLGRHVLVLADHAGASPDLGSVRYHRADVTERDDSVQRWSPARRSRVARISRGSWDYRSLDLRPASAEAQAGDGPQAEDQDTCGPYAWPDRERGQRHAQQHLDARRVRTRSFDGAGRWRRLAPGGMFGVQAHPTTDAGARFLCLSVEHRARNNLGTEVFDALEQLLGPVASPGAALPDAISGLGPVDAWALPETDFYDNRFVVLPAEATYRPQLEDGDGAQMHPKPRVHGTQSAIVVSDGEPLLSDRDHRIKVQFPWQRGSDASGGLSHPAGEDNAPASGGAWTWVRVMTPWAGDNWGGVVLPRKGQEVLVGFMEGDIDRPVVVGALYNGRGQVDAAHNQVAGGGAGATGNAPAWFDGNTHAAVYTGFKSQALGASQDGTGGYQQLRLDDTPGQGRAQVSTTQHDSTLTLGHLKGGEDNQREGERGFGAELSTQAYGAVRAGQGLLLAAEPGNAQLAAPQALSQLQQGEELLKSLADSARIQQAGLPKDKDELPVQQTLAQLQEQLKATQTGSAQAEFGGGEGEVPGWNAPNLLASGQAGVLSLTPADQAWVSGTQTALVAGHALNWLSQGHLVMAAAGGLTLYTVGSEAPAQSPVRERGIALHAAQGAVSARAHRNQAKATAKTRVQIASTQADIQVAAPNAHLLAAAAGAYLKLEGGDIELGAPGKVEFKGSQRELAGPQSASAAAQVPQGDFKGCDPQLMTAQLRYEASADVG